MGPLVPIVLAGLVVSEVVSVGERSPIAVVVVTPSGASGRVSRSEIIRQVGDLLSRDTDFAPELIDDALVKECRGSTSCLILHAEQSAYLLVISSLTANDAADLVTALLLDVERALESRSGISRESPGWQEEADAAMRSAIIARSDRTEITSSEGAYAFIESFLRDRASDALSRAGHWQPYGAIEIVSSVSGLAVRLDDATVATTSTTTTRLVGVSPGRRKLTIEHPDYAPFTTTLDVERGAMAVVKADLTRSTGDISGVRSGVLWTGVVIGAAGIVVSIVAIAKDQTGRRYCGVAEGSPPCAKDRDFRSSCYDEETGANCGGVLIAPLGFALIGFGATWALGTLLFGGDDTIPWWQMALGFVAGGAIYGVAALAD